MQLTRAADHLVDRLDADVPSLESIYDALAELAAAVTLRRVAVAIDDPWCGRQIFCSDRRAPRSLVEPSRVWTEPAIPIPADVVGRLVGTVETAFRRAAEAGAVAAVEGAVHRAVRYGLGFTLVCAVVEADRSAGLADLQSALRPGDLMMRFGGRGFVLILEAAIDDAVPAILARLSSRTGLPRLSFGVVHCPGDGQDARGLLREARNRLQDARDLAAGPPMIRAAEAACR